MAGAIQKQREVPIVELIINLLTDERVPHKTVTIHLCLRSPRAGNQAEGVSEAQGDHQVRRAHRP